MNTTVLNIEPVAPQSGERTLRVVNPAPSERRPRVAAYCRVSSDSADQLNSYASQMRYYTQIIAENPGWELADIYADEGETGLETSKRSDFLRLLRDCRAGLIDRILCKSVSRFARNYTDCIENLRELKSLGVTVLFEKEGLDTAKMTGEMMLSLQAMKAQRESLSLSGNLRRGNRMRMKNGTFVTPTPPYGYELRDKTLAVVPEKADVVKRIFADYLSGLGIEEIVKNLNAENIPTRFGGASWRNSSVRYILTNVAYVGDALWQKTRSTGTLPIRQVRNRGEVSQYYVRNDHEAIIGRADFERVQTLLEQRGAQFGGSGETAGRTLSRKLCCGECGAAFKYKPVNGKDYWTCRTHDKGAELCAMQAIPEREILAAFGRLTDKLREYADFTLAPMLAQLEAVAERIQRGDSRLSDANRELTELSDRLHNLNRLNAEGALDSALFLGKSNELNKRLIELRRTKTKLLSESGQNGKIGAVADLLVALNSETSLGELFAGIAERVTAGADCTLRFKLLCGLELTENFERVARYGLAAQNSVRL